ncbi:hypothetical protein [Mitsuokella multacida]|uniref:hypothetical protein n=1 Tax=Mitsuokella multacida TaxID=52226 RepID=UPI0039F59428
MYIKKEREWFEFFKRLSILLIFFLAVGELSFLETYSRNHLTYFYNPIHAIFTSIGGGEKILLSGYTIFTFLAIKTARKTILFIDTWRVVLIGTALYGFFTFCGGFEYGSLFWGVTCGFLSWLMELLLDYF